MSKAVTRELRDCALTVPHEPHDWLSYRCLGNVGWWELRAAGLGLVQAETATEKDRAWAHFESVLREYLKNGAKT